MAHRRLGSILTMRPLLVVGVWCVSLFGATTVAQADVTVAVSGGVVRIVDGPGSAANV